MGKAVESLQLRAKNLGMLSHTGNGRVVSDSSVKGTGAVGPITNAFLLTTSKP